MNQRIRVQRREQILDAALRLFVRRGLAGTGTAEIAAAAGVSHGLVYRYFPSKDVLYREVVELGVSESQAALASVVESAAGSPLSRLHELCAALLDLARREPSPAYVALQTMTNEGMPDEARAAMDAHGRALMRVVVELIRAGQEEGEVVSGDPMELALLFLAVIYGLTLIGGTVVRPGAATVMRLFQP